MLGKSGRVGVYLRTSALFLIFFCGYSFAQEEAPVPVLDSIPASQSEPSQPEPSQPEPPVIDEPPPAPKPTVETQPVSLDSIPKGFASQLQKNLPPPVEPPAPEPEPEPEPVAILSSSSVVSSSSAAAYNFYEDYLDSIVAYARNIVPIKQEFETQKALIKEEVPSPKTEYEKQADYDKRIGNFSSEKQKKLSKLEKEYKAEEKSRKEKLVAVVNYKPDIQPEWAGILRPDADPEGYHQRIAKLTDKITAMKARIADVGEILAGLEILSKGDLETLDKKNRIYMARLERARELMQDYILQYYASDSSTGKKKFDMALGAYDPEKERFQINMSDIYSKTEPFSYVGFIKVSPAQAQEIDRKTDNFLANIYYIKYPFLLNGEKLYPGAKKASIYYKDQEVPNEGVFQNVSGFESLEGYLEWAVYADSLISGKLVPQQLDSLYAMKKELPKVALTGTWWERNKNIVRGTLFVLSAASAGVAIWQNSEASSKTKDLKKADWYGKTVEAIELQNKGLYNTYSKRYDDGVKDIRFHENMRNGFYIGAGVFGVGGVLSLCF